jgi:hypothetical protein
LLGNVFFNAESRPARHWLQCLLLPYGHLSWAGFDEFLPILTHTALALITFCAEISVMAWLLAPVAAAVHMPVAGPRQ